MGQCGCQDGEEGHTFLEIPNYDKLLFIQRWYHCNDCGNPDGFDVQLISKKDFEDFKEWECKTEGKVREFDCLNNKKHLKDEKFCFITIKDFFPQLSWLFEEFIGDGDFSSFTEKQIEQLDKVNWKKFAKEFQKYMIKHCPNKRIFEYKK